MNFQNAECGRPRPQQCPISNRFLFHQYLTNDHVAAPEDGRTPTKTVSAPKQISKHTLSQSGLLTNEMLIGIAILAIAILPLAYSFAQENKYLRRCYERSVAMEIVDGEMEIIRAGGWRNYTNGIHTITTTARSATNLPPGELQLTLTDKLARLEWLPAATSHGSGVIREVTLK